MNQGMLGLPHKYNSTLLDSCLPELLVKSNLKLLQCNEGVTADDDVL